MANFRWFARAMIVVVVMANVASVRAAGSPDRIVQAFGSDGRLLSQSAYREGRKVGRFASFWPDGTRRVDAYYDGDVIVGRYRTWHANGQPAEVRRYENGRESGLQQAWTDRGELFLNFEARHGRHFGLINSKPCLPVRAASAGRM
jgi:antitoxin component YwqK of YwqJK toxin-antitoxin module